MAITEPEKHAESGLAPWSVKGVSPALRERIKHAARRDSLTIGAWLTETLTPILDAGTESTQDLASLDARLAAMERRAADSEPGVDWQTLGRAVAKLAARVEALEAGQTNDRNPHIEWLYRTFDNR